MKRLFWFGLGVGLTVFVVVKGRDLYHRVTPSGVSEQLERTAVRARSSVADFVDTFRTASRERERELRETLGMDAEGATS